MTSLIWNLIKNAVESFYKLRYKDDEVTSPTFLIHQKYKNEIFFPS